MRVRVIETSVDAVKTDALVVNLFEGVKKPGGATGAVDKALGGAITRLIAAGEIKGSLNEVALLHAGGALPAERVIVVGLGKQEELELDRVRQAAGTAARFAREKACRRLATIVHGAGAGGLEVGKAARAVVEGTLLGLYEPDAYKTAERKKPLEELALVEPLSPAGRGPGPEGAQGRDRARLRDLRRGARWGEIAAEATNEARALANEPANRLTPAGFAARARQTARRWGLGVSVLGPAQLRAGGFGGILGVGQGSAQTPRLVALRHGDRRARPDLALVGKGVTFDSGGISLKPQEHLEHMNADMAGAGAVLCAVEAIARLGLRLNLLALMPLAENMPSGTALRPGDVLKMLSGKTVEITTTDAEGRLLLADALAYARRQGARRIVDIATLTGACLIALGTGLAGVMGSDQGLVDRLVALGREAGDPAWPLPLVPDYKEQLASGVADLKNAGGRAAGAITAGLFLREFTDSTPWAHLDIAGTAWSDRGVPYAAKGATGFGVRILVALAEEVAGGK
jgi:leucyl aminopeptidase